MNGEGFIYAIKNKINGKCYVGVTCNIKRRIRDHFGALETGEHYNQHLQNAFNKYGRNVFEFKIIEKISKDKIFEREIFWINKLHSFKNGYNLNSGGKRFGAGEGAPWYNKHLPEYIRQKISQHVRGKNHAFYGEHRPKRTGEKISESLRKSDSIRGENHHFATITKAEGIEIYNKYHQNNDITLKELSK